MNKTRLIRQSLAYYWRTHLGVVLGATIGAAVLIGALVVGDSVKQTLRAQALARIGQFDLALTSNDRFFLDDLAERLGDSLSGSALAPALQVRGVASTTDGSQIARSVNVLGVDQRFFDQSPASDPAAAPGGDSGSGLLPSPSDNQILINSRLAQRLHIGPGDDLILRVQMPSALPRDSAFGTVLDMTLALRVIVSQVVDHDSFGRFSLTADQIPPHNAFVSREWLQQQLGAPHRSNILLVNASSDSPSLEATNQFIRDAFVMEDAQLHIVEVEGTQTSELRSDRIFIDSFVETPLVESDDQITGFLTYFVNGIEHGKRSAPYSMVTGVGSLSGDPTRLIDPILPVDLANDEIVINEWLAEDLQCGEGDTLTLRYFVIDEDDQLVEASSTFKVRSITPIQGLAADRTLMPDFPGIADAENSRDWEPGIPIDLELIRDKDEDYWDAHRGTPKAFITLHASQAMWGNRYGQLTSVRFASDSQSSIRSTLRRSIDPASLGMFFRDIRTLALAASKATTDFGGLFLALSFFLIFSALLLTALLFVFNIDQRSREIGTLMAMGYRPKEVSRLLLGEGAVLALVGSLLGAGLGVLYTRLILVALANVWSDAVASASIELHVSPMMLGIGMMASFFAATFAIWLTLRKKVRTPLVDLLQGNLSGDHNRSPQEGSRRRIINTIITIASLLGAIAIVLIIGADDQAAAPAFFGAGSLLLLGGIMLSRALLWRLQRTSDATQTTLSRLAIRNSARRVGRSLATTTLLACGVFLVVAVAVNRLDSQRGSEMRSSGTGGFALIGESTIPVLYDLNEARGRDAFGLSDEDIKDVSFVPMRIRDGDDASCLNLNLAQQPRLLGLDPSLLSMREAFTFVTHFEEAGADAGWGLLNATLTDGAVPAIADQTSAMWAMHKSVGDSIDYIDEQGRTIKVKIVATIAASILQGNLIISEDRFRAMYPSEFGSRSFLIDA
ncbi:MAG: FtsX-like permease family protein, partial [Planctomycetota bacterium]|nr:FtsX-like permease family protein [Planctomycetota bacterium]